MCYLGRHSRTNDFANDGGGGGGKTGGWGGGGAALGGKIPGGTKRGVKIKF